MNRSDGQRDDEQAKAKHRKHPSERARRKQIEKRRKKTLDMTNPRTSKKTQGQTEYTRREHGVCEARNQDDMQKIEEWLKAKLTR